MPCLYISRRTISIAVKAKKNTNMKARRQSTERAAHVVLGSLPAKSARLKQKVKRLVNVHKTRKAILSGVPTSSSQLKRKPQLHNLFKRKTQISAIQHLCIRQAVPLTSECEGSHDQFALRVSTIVVAILLSLILIAEIMFLPFRILALQGMPLFLVMVIAMYLWLQHVQGLESVLDESR